MENGHEINASTMDGSLVMPLDPSEHSRSPQDLLTRRLKNRERQRRYRARKRLEADMKKASILNQSAPPQVPLPGPPNPHVTRVHCKRDWKQDARRAHLYREKVDKSTNTITMNTISVAGDQMPCLPSGVDSQLPVDSGSQSMNSSVPENSETPMNTPNRRNWKAEARNKKN